MSSIAILVSSLDNRQVRLECILSFHFLKCVLDPKKHKQHFVVSILFCFIFWQIFGLFMFSNQTSGGNIKTNNFSSITHVILHFGKVID